MPLIVPNPYKGLRAFDEADAREFFGREALVEKLIRHLSEDSTRPGQVSRFLAVVGPSGSGKSSVVKAGLIPALRRGALPGSEKWFIITLTPGNHPLEELEIGLLRMAVTQPPGLMEQLCRDERGLLRAARLALPGETSELVLIIDQFEELFTLAEDKNETAHFLALLFAAASDPRSRLRIIITLRADFYDRPLAAPNFSSLVQQHTEVVVPLTAEELASAIQKPALNVGAVFEPGLVATIAADVSQQPGALPLLQYALTELFEQRQGSLLTQSAYKSFGGVMGVLGGRAEEVYASLDKAEQEAARQLFLRLVTLGEGTEDTRRRVLRAELEALTVDWRPLTVGETSAAPVYGQLSSVIQSFGHARLLSFDRDPATRAPTVEVAHEALLHEWPRLRDWLDNGRADIRQQRLLANAAAEWQAANREASFLLHGARLSQFEGWAASRQIALTSDEHRFLEASLADRDAQAQAEADRQQRELETAQKLAASERQRAEEQSRSAASLRKRAVYLSAALLAVAVLAIISIVLARQANLSTRAAEANAMQARTAEAQAVQEQIAAQQQADLAFSRELVVAANYNLTIDPDLSLLLALQAISITNTWDMQDALHQAIQATRVRMTLPVGGSYPLGIDYSPDGKLFATGLGDGRIIVWESASGEKQLTLQNGQKQVYDVAFSPDGRWLAAGGGDKTVTIWDPATGEAITTLTGHTDWISSLAFTLDGKRLASAGGDGQVIIWDFSNPPSATRLFTLSHPEAVLEVAFSPNGAFLAAAVNDGTAVIWDTASGEQVFTLPASPATVYSAAFSPDGSRLVTGGGDGIVKIWDLSTSLATRAVTETNVVALAGVHRLAVSSVAFTPDGQFLVTASQEGIATVWDTMTFEAIFTLTGHKAAVDGLAISPDGQFAATISRDGTLKMWDLALTGNQEVLDYPLGGGIVAGNFTPDGSRLITFGSGNLAVIQDIASGRQLSSLTIAIPEGRSVNGITLSPDGSRIATISYETVFLWDAATGALQQTLSGHKQFINSLVFSPDGKFLATASDDNTARVWDAATGAPRLTLAHDASVRLVAFDPAGDWLATVDDDHIIRTWDLASGRPISQMEGHTLVIMDVAVSPDGARLATCSIDGTARIWDIASGKELLKLAGHTGSVIGVAFDPTGSLLATISADGTTRLWDAAAGQQLLTLDSQQPGIDVIFSPDSAHLATMSLDRVIRTYALRPDELTQIAMSRLTRWWTPAECQRYLHTAVCPARP